MSPEKIASEDFIFLKVSKPDLIFLKVSKLDFLHAVLWVFNWILILSEKIALRTSYFWRFVNTICRMRSFEFLFRFSCYQRRSRRRTSYFSRFLILMSRMRSFEFLIWFLCNQRRSRLKTSYFWNFEHDVSHEVPWVFNLIPMSSEKIAPEDLIFLMFLNSTLLMSHEFNQFSRYALSFPLWRCVMI